jgi:hypothetical protein
MIRVASDGALVKIENGKQREDARSASLILAATPHAGSMVLSSSAEGGLPSTDSEVTIRRSLRDLLGAKDNVTHSELKRACLSLGMGDGTFNWALRKQIEAGAIVKMNRSYHLAHPGQARLEIPEETDPGE